MWSEDILKMLSGNTGGEITPDQIAQQRGMAQRDLSYDPPKENMAGGFGPIAAAVKALSGTMRNNNANFMERQMQDNKANAINDPSGPGGGAGPTMGDTAKSYMASTAGPPVSKPVVPSTPSAGGIPTPPPTPAPMAPGKAVPWMNFGGQAPGNASGGMPNFLMNNPFMKAINNAGGGPEMNNLWSKFSQRFGNWGG